MSVRLNLGCGDLPLDGWLNIDYRPDHADTIADAQHLPIASGSATHVQALDLLEHFPHDLTQRILAEWRRCLQPRGQLTVKVPNMLALSHAIVARPHAAAIYIRNVYGGHRWGPDGAWDCHHTGWVPEGICRELAVAGYTITALDDDLNMTVTAVRD